MTDLEQNQTPNTEPTSDLLALEPEDFNWGGDGSDPNEPVRAHVVAALVPTDAPYPPPLDQLLQLGEVRDMVNPDARIATLGLTQEHVPDLVRMARDRALNTAMSDSAEVWAPIHALEALKNLDISAYVEELIPLFDVDSDWFDEELPEVLGNAGEVALGPLQQYLHDRTRWISGRINAASAITAAAQQNPELRERAIAIFAKELDQGTANDPELNGLLLAELLDLDAVEALPAIRRAFEADAIDESVAGDWGEVQEALGVEPDPNDPLLIRSRARRAAQVEAMRALFPSRSATAEREISAPSKKAKKTSVEAKRKNKRKIAAASRKANKKKRKK